ncbi:hypothetical protein CMV_027896, partial [Castanea mollissima]
YWKSRFFFVSGDDFETPSGGVWGELPRLSRQWGTPTLVKRRPKLKSRYKERVEKAIEYARRLKIGTTWWTRELLHSIALAQSLLLLSCVTSGLREKRK